MSILSFTSRVPSHVRAWQGYAHLVINETRATAKSISGFAIACGLLILTSTTIAVSAQEVAVFSLDELPYEMQVTPEDKLRFQLVDSLNDETPDSYIVTVPLGISYVFDSLTHIFSYTGSVAQKEEFEVEFTANFTDTTVSRVLTIVPRLRVFPEAEILAKPTNFIPNASSAEYFVVTESLGPTKFMNYLERQTREIEVVGGEVIIDQGTRTMSYFGAKDINHLLIVADVVRIRDRLYLPQANVTIKARLVIFEDRDTLSIGSIDVTPVSLQEPALNIGIGEEKGADGEDGLDAGTIGFFVDGFITPQGDDKMRLIANGSRGREGGAGRDGANGLSRPVIGGTYTSNGVVYSMVYYVRTWRERTGFFRKNVTRKDERGANTFPKDGESGKSPGKSGSGGAGGAILSNVDVSWISDVTGGLPGAQPDTTYGGTGGEPRASFKYTAYRSNPVRRYYYITQDGADAPPPLPDRPIGDSGRIEITQADYSWLTAAQARNVTRMAKSAYVNGNTAYVTNVLSEYTMAIEAYQQTDQWELISRYEQVALEAIASENLSILERVSSGLDVFGEIGGFVPYLSFDYLFQTYDKRVSADLEALYFIYLFENATTTFQEKKDALELLRSQKINELELLYAEYASSNELLPPLGLELSRMKVQQDSLEVELNRIEKTLLDRANKRVKKRNEINKIKRISSIAGTIIGFVPGLQTVGLALSTAASLDYSDPLSFRNAATVLSAVNKIQAGDLTYNKALEETLGSAKKAVDKIIDGDILDYAKNPDFRAEINGLIKDVEKKSKPLIEAQKQITSNYQGIKVSNRAVQIELAKLISQSSDYQNVAKKIGAVKQSQVGVIENNNKVRNIILRNQQELVQAMLAIDALSQSISSNEEYIDADLISYVADMRARSEEHLLLFHRLLARSFEYRMLKPYPHRLDLSPLYNRFSELLQAGQKERLTADQFDGLKVVFDDVLSQIIADLINNYSFNRKQAKASFRLTKEQLEQFNTTGSIAINPSDYIFDMYQDVRLLDFKVIKADFDTNTDHITHQLVKIEAKHSGISMLTSGSDTWVFNNVSITNPKPHVYGSNVDPVSNRITYEGPSVLDESLLKSILSVGGFSAIDIEFFSHPGVDSEMMVTRYDLSGQGAERIAFSDVIFEISYDYTDMPSNLAKVAVSSNIGMPAVYVDTPDLNGRSHGHMGGMTRFYSKSYTQKVLFEVVETYGEYRFSHFEDGQSRLLKGESGDPTKISLPLYETSQRLEAHYELYKTELALADSLRIGHSEGNAEMLIESKGADTTLVWQIEEASNWIGLNDGESGEGQAMYEFGHEANPIHETRYGYIIVSNRDELDDIDTIVIVQEPKPEMLSQTIGVGSHSEATYGDLPVGISITGGDSGNPVMITSSRPNVAEIEGNKLHIYMVGTTEFTAIQEGNEEYRDAEPLIWQLEVNPARLRIIANHKEKYYQGELPVFDFTIEGWKNGDGIGDITLPDIFTEATVDSDVGVYPIKLNGGSSNQYILEKVEGLLTVKRSPITLIPTNLYRQYGDTSAVKLEYTIAGLRGDDTPDVIQNVKLSTEVTAKSPVGNYPITIETVDSDNYRIIKALGSVTVEKAPLVVRVKDYSRTYGSVNPKAHEWELEYIGFKNQDGPESIRIPDVITTASKSSNVGEYAIRLLNASGSNYTIETQDGKLVIEKAILSVCPESYVREYGSENPSVWNILYEGFVLNDKETDISAPEVNVAADASSPVGEWAVTLKNGESTNYQFEYCKGTLSITPASLLAVPESVKRGYGLENDPIKIIYTGFKNGDDESSIEAPVASTTATKESAIGTFPISLEGGESENYIISLGTGELEVIPAPLRFTVESAEKTFGEENPDFKYLVEGWRLNDTITDITLPVFTTEAEQFSDAGTFSIDMTSGYAENYQIIVTPGVLQVNKAPLKVIADSYTRLLGQSNPEYFNTRAEGFVDGRKLEDLDEVPLAVSEADESSPRGQYAITFAQGIDKNYLLEFEEGTLTVVAPEIELPEAITFEENPIGIEATMSLTLENNGDAYWGVQNVQLPEGFSITLKNFVLEPGDQIELILAFIPTEIKEYTGDLVMTTNIGELLIPITGIGALVTSIESEQAKEELIVYPNPADITLNIDLTRVIGVPKSLTIIDNSGRSQLVYQQDISSSFLDIDVSRLRAGVYILQIQTDQGVIKKRVLIQR